MTRYTAVLMPLETGAWRAYFPDLVGCGREADNRATALDLATKAAKESLDRLPKQQAVPFSRSVDQIRADHRWAAERAINWYKAVFVVVEL